MTKRLPYINYFIILIVSSGVDRYRNNVKCQLQEFEMTIRIVCPCHTFSNLVHAIYVNEIEKYEK